MNWKLFSRRGKHDHAEAWNIRTMFGPNLSFAATEAYKLLRTNIMFSFSDEGEGYVIGISSSIQSEGKSSTACNTAYALSEAGCRVLLLECDLRRPTIGAKLNIARAPGLTNLLTSRTEYRELVQKSPAAPKLEIITSGDIPPNPSELLSSNRMAKLIEQLRQEYDYIVVDLPPITAVSDALAMSRFLDGVIMVVRSGVSDQQMLAEALRQLEMVSVRILGFAYRDTGNVGTKYGKRYAKKYYKYYNEYAKSRR